MIVLIHSSGMQTWVSLVTFCLGVLVASGVAVVGLTAMEVVPAHQVGSAHGLACAVAQGTYICFRRTVEVCHNIFLKWFLVPCICHLRRD